MKRMLSLSTLLHKKTYSQLNLRQEGNDKMLLIFFSCLSSGHDKNMKKRMKTNKKKPKLGEKDLVLCLLVILAFCLT